MNFRCQPVRLARLTAGLGLALALTVAASTTALAHATLIRSSLGNGTVLATSPADVQLEFDVPVNARLSAVQLWDQAGHRVLGPTIEPVPDVSSDLTIDLPSLRQGVYRLHYQARDDTDLHQTSGDIVFGVGQAAVTPPQAAVTPSPSYLETGIRWLELAGTCLLVGVVAVWLGILPAVGRRRSLSGWTRSRLLTIATVGYAAFLVGKAGQLLIAAGGLLPAAATSWPAAIWTALTAGRFGLLWLAAMGAAALVLVVAGAALAHPSSRLVAGALVLATTVLLVITTATSHGANQSGPEPGLIALRTVHLGAAGLWVGGLSVIVFLFAGALRGGSPEAPAALLAFRRFTGLAFIAVGLLTVSGLMLVGRGVASAAQLVTTTYGLTLVAKLIAGGAAFGFGIRHTLLLSPPRGGGVGGPVKLARSVPFEVGAMLVVLWGAAALGATAPAPPVDATPSVGPALQADTTALVGGLVVHSQMDPEQPGPNTLFVMVRAAPPSSDLGIAGVVATLSQPGHPLVTLVGRAVGGGGFEFPAAQVAAAGKLSVALAITRSDGTVVRTTCDWMVAAPPPAPPPGLPSTPWAQLLNSVAEGLALALAGALSTRLVMGRLRRAPAR
jgi:copper transport protein